MSDSLRSFSLAARFPLSRFRRSAHSDETVAIGPRGRLFRKYVLLIIGLVSLVLLLNSALDFWFSYEENKEALFRIQQEKAGSAARRIEQFIDEIERQLGWTTAPQWAASPLEQRRFDYVRLLRQAPAITELIQLDDTGKEQLKVSRLAIDVVGSEKDYSQSPSFIEARQHRVWFSPVYFRKESEPYMTVALARTGRNAGVTVAEVNLKLIWDVITGLKTGQGGYAYVVDRDGRLIAHPDISLVLRNTDLTTLPQVAAAHAEAPSLPSPASGGGLGWGLPSDQAVTVAKGIDSKPVLTAHAGIAPLGWTVFVELPLNEALAPLYGSMLRTAALLVLALVLATLAALLLARRMTVPIRELQAGAARIGAGELDRHIEIQTGDELEDLAGDFNRMASDLQKSYANLEKKVEDRTAELKEALEQQTATAEVLGVINSSPGDLTPVFDAMLEKALTLCEAVCGQLATFDGEMFEFVALKGDTRWLERRPQGRLPPSRGLTWSRIVAGEPYVHILDALETEAHRLGQEGARDAAIAGGRTFLTVALRREQALLGALTVYRQEVRQFSDKQIALLQNFAAQAVIAMENARLLTETREALEQQTATAEVLQVINSSPGDLAPVFEAIVEKAHGLCDAACGSLQLWDGEKFRGVAMRGFSEAMAEGLRQGYIPGPNHPCRRLLEGERIAHCADLAEIDDPVTRAGGVAQGGIRTILFVALRKDDVLLGQIAAARQEVRPFSENEIALVENFAAQAVIAMENARLITETREALEQQTATAEVLQVINSSPGDLHPVFDAMLEKAMALSGASFGGLSTYDGDQFLAVATHGVPAALKGFFRNAYTVSPQSYFGQLVGGKTLLHVADLAAEGPLGTAPLSRAGVERGRAFVDLGKARTGLFLALRKEEALLGILWFYRQEVRPFSEKQIALLQNFAAQAVIAMENARLITETREALEQQTATAEVLQVINSSPGDLAPVFDAILEKAHTLCGAAHGSLQLYDGENLHAVATNAVSDEFADILRQGYRAADSPASQALIEGKPFAHIADCAEIDHPVFRSAAELAGIHTVLFVPLGKDGAFLGLISAARLEVRPFSEKEIALLQNFAAQAVIAMENARLITETREALEQQTATAEVLQVINSSPGDLAPVFDAMLEKALRLCDAAFGVLWTGEGESYRAAALRGVPPAYAEFVTREQRGRQPGGALGRLCGGEPLVHIPDTSASTPDEMGRTLDELGGIRTLLAVPLRKEDAVLGAFTIYRQEVRPFSDKQIALLQNFAAQAVIAMENARLITETHEALEQQTATAEVLQVINGSPGDLAPVFDAMLEKAVRLCDAKFGILFSYHGEHFRPTAFRGVPTAYADYLNQAPLRPGPQTALGRVVRGESLIAVSDSADDDAYRSGDPLRRARVELGGARSAVTCALRKDDALLGVFTIYRQEVLPFSAKQIALLENFAAQAVIAMENARLITELRQRTHDLQETLEYQTASSDVLKVISQSTFDLEPVLQTVLDTAMRLCGNSQGEIFRLEDGVYRMAVGYGMEPGYRDIEAKLVITPGPDTLVGRTALEGRPVQIIDALADPDYAPKGDAQVGKLRSMLGVPLLREGVPIGVICTARTTVEPFTEKQITLVSTFADQAVIAIENARLFNELRARTEELGSSVAELKMLSEVGQAVSSTLDLRAVLSTILNASLGVTWANAGAIFRYVRAERAFRLVEAVGWDEPLLRSVRDLRVAEAETAMGEAAAQRMPIQLAELAQRPSAPLRDASLAAGFHSALIVPLVGAERILGAIILMRQEAGEFPAETVRLMQTLASQSVLAIQNARLFREIADKSEQLALASQHKSQFLANMSHELRTPLNAILGYAELLVDGIYGVLPDRPRGVLDRIQNNGKHLLALINDVLDLAKIEAGQLTLTLEDYSVPEVVKSVVTATEPLAASKGLKFTAALPDGLPMAHGDARRVSQVLLNLVGNAIKFTDKGEVEIRAMVDKGQFVLTVRDTGPGIADADQERIFGEFQQIDNSNTRKKGGTGLGLAISKRMVEMQGGTISVDSVLGHGSTFRVVLPVHVDEMMEAA